MKTLDDTAQNTCKTTLWLSTKQRHHLLLESCILFTLPPGSWVVLNQVLQLSTCFNNLVDFIKNRTIYFIFMLQHICCLSWFLKSPTQGLSFKQVPKTLSISWASWAGIKEGCVYQSNIIYDMENLNPFSATHKSIECFCTSHVQINAREQKPMLIMICWYIFELLKPDRWNILL